MTDRFVLVPASYVYLLREGDDGTEVLLLCSNNYLGLTADERRTQMTLWSISAAPLVLGTDLTHMDSADLSLLTNDEVLGVDRAGRPAHPVKQGAQQQTWWAYNGDGTYTVGLFNLGDQEQTVTARFADLKLAGKQTVRDLWRQKDLATVENQFEASVPPHGVVLVKLTPAK